jgi:hypothetical protein
MAEKTVTVGDTEDRSHSTSDGESITVSVGDREVQITETADGFAAEAIEEEEDEHDLFLRAQSTGDYGFEIPLAHADQFMLAKRRHGGSNDVAAFWNTDYNVSSLKSRGTEKRGAFEKDIPSRFDGHAVVSADNVEVVQR